MNLTLHMFFVPYECLVDAPDDNENKIFYVLIQTNRNPLDRLKYTIMGQDQSCELDGMANLCLMEKCIMHIQGMAKNSVSPCDIWICTLKPNTTFRGILVKRVCMKISVNVKSGGDYGQNFRLQSLSLMFELKVYDQVITPILDAGLCPNFLRSYLVSDHCEYKHLAATLAAGLPRDRAIAKLNRSLHYILGQREKNDVRPPIDSPLKPGDLWPRPPRGIRFNVLSTEFTNVISYRQWLKMPAVGDETRSLHSTLEKSVVLIQILVALYVMSKSRLMHNDLHPGNILIQTLNQEETWTYEINGQRVTTISPRYKAMIFDFDRATCKFLGHNYVPGWNGEFVELNDLACLAAALQKEDLLSGSGISSFFDVHINANVRWNLASGKDIKNSLVDGMKRCAKYIATHAQPGAALGTVFRIEDDMFNPDGSLKNRHRESLSRGPDALQEVRQAREEMLQAREDELSIEEAAFHKKPTYGKSRQPNVRSEVRAGPYTRRG